MPTDLCQKLFTTINYYSDLKKLLSVCSEVDVEFVINVINVYGEIDTNHRMQTACLDVPESKVYL